MDLDQKIAALTKAAKKGDAMGYHSNIEKNQDTAKWVQVDLGRSVALGSVVLHPCKDDFNGIGEGFGFPVRFKVEVSDDDADEDVLEDTSDLEDDTDAIVEVEQENGEEER